MLVFPPDHCFTDSVVTAETVVEDDWGDRNTLPMTERSTRLERQRERESMRERQTDRSNDQIKNKKHYLLGEYLLSEDRPTGRLAFSEARGKAGVTRPWGGETWTCWNPLSSAATRTQQSSKARPADGKSQEDSTIPEERRKRGSRQAGVTASQFSTGSQTHPMIQGLGASPLPPPG